MFIYQNAGASNTTQSYSPGCAVPNNTSLNSSLTSSGSNTPNSTSTNMTASTSSITTISGGKKSSFVRPKSAEPSSPLLRRALSPDRLHPRSAADAKCSISPLCCTSNAMPSVSSLNMHAANAVIGLKKQRNQKNSGNIWRQNITTKQCGVCFFLYDEIYIYLYIFFMMKFTSHFTFIVFVFLFNSSTGITQFSIRWI